MHAMVSAPAPHGPYYISARVNAAFIVVVVCAEAGRAIHRPAPDCSAQKVAAKQEARVHAANYAYTELRGRSPLLPGCATKAEPPKK